MRNLWIKSNLCVFLFIAPFSLLLSSQNQILLSSDQTNSFRNISPSFVENLGQFDDLVKYSLSFSGRQIFLTPQEIVFQSSSRTDRGQSVVHNDRLRFVGSNPQTEIKGLNKGRATFNYLRGNDSKLWIKGAQTFESVLYEEIYPNIDLVLDGELGLEVIEFHIKPGGNVHQIQLEFDGKKIDAEEVNLYQREDIIKLQIRKIVRKLELAVDPVLDYSTFLGGSDEEEAWVIAVDSFGCAYVAGETYLSDYPTTFGSYDTDFSGGGDIFVSKFDPSGSNLIFSTFIGGSADDPEGMEGADGIAVDAMGNVFLTGWTSATDFPTTPTAFDRSFNGGGHEYYVDAFVIKLDASGSSLLYSTFLGGSRDEEGNGIVLDNSGGIFLVGDTNSTDFPTTANALDTSLNGRQDVFVANLVSSVSSLAFSTFLGGDRDDESDGIAIDDSGSVYMTGWTKSSNFPTTPGAYNTSYNGAQDVFVSKISVDKSSISGFVSTALGDGIKNVILSFSNSGGEAFTDFEGYYSHSLREGWSGTVTPIKLNYSFTPVSRNYVGVETDITNQNYSGIIDTFSDQAPLNFLGLQNENRSLSQLEYINVLEWQDNPSHTDVVKYRIYQQDGDSQVLLAELNAGISRHLHRNVNKDISYEYALVAVNSEGKESLPAYAEIL